MRKLNHMQVLMMCTLIFALCTCTTMLSAQDLKSSLFEKADEALKQANGSTANRLSPTLYAKGLEAYQKAEKEFNSGKNLDKIRTQLRASVQFFQDAIKASKLVNERLATTLKARSDADMAGTAEYAGDEWQNAENKFNEAAKKMERGDLDGAQEKAGEAERYYRKAELIAVKANFLDETRSLLEVADKNKVEKLAPLTLARARELLQTAEVELEKNRYDTDYPRSLAKQAKYEVKHALYLAETINTFRKNELTIEDLLLLSEKPLEDIAGVIGLLARFDNGYNQITVLIKNYIQDLEEKHNIAQQEITDKRQQLKMAQAQVDELTEELGGITREKSKLAKEIEAQNQLRSKYEEIGKTFTKEEAQVRRTPENNLIIRLIGLNFKSGKAEIDSKYFGLLAKVKKAVNIFPNCSIQIEGHTDSFGGDKMNQELSQKRADAVCNYLLANMNLIESRIISRGFGETKPIANNETKAGRTRNRRIDILLIQ
ncbi:OmpA family protein [bacterium]|nr:OmpA family protein [bacterium]